MRETAQIRGYPFQLPRTLIHLLPYWVSIPASPQRHPIVLQTWTIEYSCLYQAGPMCFPFCSQTTAWSYIPQIPREFSSRLSHFFNGHPSLELIFITAKSMKDMPTMDWWLFKVVCFVQKTNRSKTMWLNSYSTFWNTRTLGSDPKWL